MRRFFSLLTLATLFLPFATQAASVSSGDLIKASGPTVYYLGADSRRYVFPTDKTYFSWYSDFSQVKTISDTDLASYTLGGNVTYRPGTKMVKITTDPKVYAVDQHGMLRWVQTEQIATTLYGTDWAKKIDDIPDAFFINYKIGTPIATSNDFNPAVAQTTATSINLDKQLIGQSNPPPGPTPSLPPIASYNATITPSKTQPALGELINLLGVASPAQGVSTISLFFDNNLIKTCEYNPCVSDITVPLYGTKPSYEMKAVVSWMDGHRVTTVGTLTPVNTTSSSVTLTLTREEIRPGQARAVTVNISTEFSARFIDLYLDDVAIHGCDSKQQCQFSDTETSAVGTIHKIYAIARDSLGNSRQSATKTLRVVSNDHPYLTFGLNKTILPKNETLEVTLSATDDDGITWTEIWLNNALLKHCAAPTCNLVLGPWNQSQALHLNGAAQDFLGLTATSTVVDVTVQ